ncbi:hypothetical protein DSM112329_03881 [Paraconexibacter sp. AEG42_29]|uniref:VCBS repeat-containing protein n=2 Tax=Paraconexibacter sp. AEG42_29 TaxID=2997339 RepID=A0AAU7AZD8_9ACTN
MRGLVVLVVACVGLVAGGVAGPAAAQAQNRVQAGAVAKTSGAVTATLSWKAGQFAVTKPRLTIARGGTVVSDLDVSDVCKDCLLVEDTAGNADEVFTIMHVADLTGDGEPEVSFDTFSNGAHCCTTQRIYAYRPATNSYRRVLSLYWGNVGYEVKDLDGDGTAELSGADDSFAYAFSSYAASAFPPKVLSLSLNAATGKAAVKDITRRFPAMIRSDAARLLKAIRAAKPEENREIQGAIAAYVAEQYLLGKGAVGKAEIVRARKRGLTAPGFQTNLLAFLKRTGYR